MKNLNYKIIIKDNFLKKTELNELKNLNLKKIRKDEIMVYQNTISKNNTINSTVLSNNFIKKLHKSYHDRAIKILKNLCQEKAKLYNYSEFYLIQTGANYKFPIHDDTPNKLLSGVVYISPSKNSGTIFYEDKKGTNKKKIEWKTNRAVFFSRVEKHTWHSYEGDRKNNRLALVYNLMTNESNFKDVYKIEKKNYWIGLFRYKINPYLYKYFKLTV